jgi:hypothetical protein
MSRWLVVNDPNMVSTENHVAKITAPETFRGTEKNLLETSRIEVEAKTMGINKGVDRPDTQGEEQFKKKTIYN